MADNLATGIGLSGRFELTNEGRQAVVAAERDLYGERQRQKKEEEAKKRANAEKMASDTVFSTRFKTPRFQREWEGKAIDAMNNIVSASANGDNGFVVGYNELNNFKRYTNALIEQDNALQETLKTVSKDPTAYGFSKRSEYNGKTYDNWYQMFNDNDVPLEDFKSQYTGSEFGFVQDPQLGELFIYNPIKRITESDVIKSLQPEEFNTPYTEEIKGPSGKKNFSVLSYGIDPKKADAFVTTLMNSPYGVGLMRNWEDQIVDEMKASDPNFSDISLRQDQSLFQQKINEKAQAFRDRIRGLRANRSQISNQYPEPKQTSEGGASWADNWALSTYVSDDGTVKGATMSPKTATTTAARNISIPKGATILEAGSYDGKEKPITKTVDGIQSTPFGFEWDVKKKGLDGAMFKYSSEYNTENQKTGGMNVYRIPLNRESFSNFVSASRSTDEDVMQMIRSVSDQDQLKSIDDWYNGVVTEDKPKADKEATMPPAPSKGGSTSMITVVLNGKTGQIPSDKIDEFMKKYPNAQRK